MQRCQFNRFSQTVALKQTTPCIQAVDVTAEAFIQMSCEFNRMTKMLQEKRKERVETKTLLSTEGNTSLTRCLNSLWCIKKIKITPL